MATSCIENINPIRSFSWEHLHQVDEHVKLPFQLALADCETPLICEEIIRIIPKKRLVVFGIWDNKPVVAKLFFESKSVKRHLQRDINGIETLISSGIPTPKLFFQGFVKNQRVSVLILEKIMGCKDLDSLWQEKKSLDEMTLLMKKVTIELATQHVLGIMQNDLHLKNFLIAENQIYTLDGGNIQKHAAILSKEQSIEHLALFFAQLGVGTEQLQQTLFEVYAKSRGWIIKKSDHELLRMFTNTWLAKRWAQYQKKIWRNCTAFARIKTFKKTMLYDRTFQCQELNHFFENPDAIFHHPDAEILKSGRTSTVAKFKMNNRYVVLKRYNIKNIGHGLRRCLRMTRAACSWELAQRLRFKGIPTAKPLAFVENRILGFRGTSYLLMEYVDGPHLGDYFQHYSEQDPRYNKIANRVLMLFSHLLHLNLTHGDLKMTNILIHNEQPLLIDLDGMINHRTELGLRYAYRKEITRFMKNWENYPSVRKLFENLLNY